MFKTETHLHTSEGSACASASGKQQAEQYKAMGYSTIFVTDHFYNGNTAADRSLPWSEWVEAYCKGFENALEAGKEIGLNVIFGIEYGWGGADFLAYGIDKEWLLREPDIINVPVWEFCRKVRESGGIVIQAHPFRQADYLKAIKLLPEYVDGVEVLNAGNREDIYNQRAKWYAEQFGLPQTAGTDCHHVGGYDFTGVLTEYEIKTAGDYIRAVRNNGIKGFVSLENK